MKDQAAYEAPVASRILVIDDEQEMLKNYQRLLKRAGHQCQACSDARDIERLLADFRPEIVVTDLMMPEVSGMDVLQRVRAWDETIPVILVTAYGSVENAVSAMKLKAADFLSKPFSMDELLQKVQEALSKRLIERAPNATAPLDDLGHEGVQGIIGISGHAAAFRAPAQGGAHGCQRAGHRRKRHRQGSDGEVSSRSLETRQQAVHLHQLRRHPRKPARKRTLRAPAGSRSPTRGRRDKKGLLEFAHKGTLFLDEIGEIPPRLAGQAAARAARARVPPHRWAWPDRR